MYISSMYDQTNKYAKWLTTELKDNVESMDTKQQFGPQSECPTTKYCSH